MSRIFLSHSSRDNPRASELRDWLTANGWDDVFLDLDPVAGLAPGERWQNALKAAADRCEAVLFLVSPNWLNSPWCLSEFLLAKQLGKRLFPLLIGGVSIDALPSEIASDHQAVDLVGDPLGWERLKEGLLRAGLDANSFSFARGRRPYPGFEPLTEEDAAIFFGREAQVLRGLDRLRLMRDTGAERMMVVLGASGAGKSSFLRAGLWPRLRRDDRNFWPLPTIRPERAVLSGKSGLYAALEWTLADARVAKRPELAALPRARASLGAMIARECGLASFFAALRQAALQSLAHGPAPPPTPVLMIDQAEELLNEEGRAESERFMEILARTLEAEKGLIVVLAIRSDAFPQFQAAPGLAGVAREPFDLAPMPAGSLRLVIEGPAKLATPPLKPAPALVDALLADSTGQDALPLLAFTLDRLAREYGAEGTLTLENYLAGGGVRGAIVAAVEDALSEGRRRGATPADSKALENLLKQAFIPHLARVNEAGEFARRIAYPHEIPAPARRLVDLLVEARLLTRNRDEYGEVVEVAHEALLREWPLLRGFLEADREFLVGKRQLVDDLKIWREAPAKGKSEAMLTGLRLSRAQHWLAERSAHDLTADERAFIGESARAAEAARRRRSALVLAAIALLAAFSALAAYQWVNATKETAVAQANAARAEAEKARANSNEEEAKRNADKAKLNAVEAQKAKDQAEENAGKAETNEARARSAQAKAQIQVSSSLADLSLRQTASGDDVGAMRNALAALPSDPAKPERPYVPKAEYALAKAFLTNRLEAAITPGADWVNEAAFSPDGSRIALGTRDDFFKIYDATTARELKAINERRLAVLTLAYSGDGKRLVTAHQNPPSLIVRDAVSGAAIRSLRLNALPSKVVLTHDGSTIVVIGQGSDARPIVLDRLDDGGRTRAFDLAGHSLREPGMNGLKTIAFSPDERLLMMVTHSGVYVWDLQSGAVVATSLDVAPSNASSVAKFDFSKVESDQEYLYGAAFLKDSGDAVLIGKRNVYIVDPRTGAIKTSRRYSEDWQVAMVKAPMLSPSGDRVAFPINNRTLATYSFPEWRLLAKRELPSDITNTAISPDGKIVAVSGEDFIVRAWPIDSETPLGVFPGHAERIGGIVFSPDSTHMISYGDNMARLWDLREIGARLGALPSIWRSEIVDAHVQVASVVAAEDYSQTGAADAPRNGILRFSQPGLAASDAMKAFFNDGARALAFSRSGRWVAVRQDYQASDELVTLKARSEILTRLIGEAGQGDAPVEVRPNEDLDVIAVVDVETGEAAHVLIAKGEQRMPKDVAFVGNDGVVLGLSAEIYADSDKEESKSFAEIWDVAAAKKLLSISQDGHKAKLTYSEAGRCVTLTTALKLKWGSHVASIWSVATGAMIRRLDLPQRLDHDEDAAEALLQRDRVMFGDEEAKPALVEASTGKEVGAVAGAATGASRLIMSVDRRRLLIEGVNAPRALWSLDDNKSLALIPGSGFDWSNAVFTEDGRRIVMRGRRDNNDTIEVYDSETGARLGALPKLETTLDYYGGLTGARVAVETDRRTIEIREVGSQAPPVHIALDNDLHRWRFSASDERFVTVDEAGKLQVWDARTGALIFELAGVDTIEPLGGAPLTGTHVPFLLAKGGAALLDTRRAEIVWRSPEGVEISGLQLLPDEKSIVVLGPHEIGLFALDPAEKIASMPIGSGEQSFYGYNEPGDRVEFLVRGAGGLVRLLDVPGRKEIARYDNVGTAGLATKAANLAIATPHMLTLRDARTGTLRREIQFERPIRTVEFNFAGDGLAVVTDDFKVWVVDANEGAPKLVASLRANPTWIRFAADRSKLLIYENSNQATLRDTASGNVLTSFQTEWAEKASLNKWIERLDPSGTLLAVRSPDNYVRIYRTADGARISEINWDDNVFADMAFTADAKGLLLVTEKGRIANWDIAAGKSSPAVQLAREYSSFDSVTLKRTPDSRQMLAIDKQGRVDLFSLNTNSVRTFYSGEPDRNVNATLSPDGSLLAVLGEGGVLRLWHVGAREILAEIPGLTVFNSMVDMRFSPDGRILAVSGQHNGVVLIRMPLIGDGLLRAAKDLLSRLPAPQADAPAPRNYRLGVVMNDVPADAAQRYRHPPPPGAEVNEVFADSPAQAAGVRVGDVIVKVNGTPVANVAQTLAAIKGAHLDLSLDIFRDGAPVSARAALDD
jgi:WD40 repeat protein